MRCRWWSSVSMHGTHLAHTFRYSNFSVKVLPMVLRETSGTKMQRSSRVILRSWRKICSTFATVSSEIDGLPLLSSSCISVQPAVNFLHHLRTFVTSMHDSPYTSVNWGWISIGLTPFAFKNQITARTSHLAGAASGSSITNGCRAKTECPSGLSDGLFGSGGTNKHSRVANSHANSFPAAPLLWRPYFWDHLRSIDELIPNSVSVTTQNINVKEDKIVCHHDHTISLFSYRFGMSTTHGNLIEISTIFSIKILYKNLLITH